MNSELEKAIQKMRDDETIFCPHCNHKMSDDDGAYPITYGGQEDIYDFDCSECGETFWVEEFVTRVFHVTKDNRYDFCKEVKK